MKSLVCSAVALLLGASNVFAAESPEFSYVDIGTIKILAQNSTAETALADAQGKPIEVENPAASAFSAQLKDALVQQQALRALLLRYGVRVGKELTQEQQGHVSGGLIVGIHGEMSGKGYEVMNKDGEIFEIATNGPSIDELRKVILEQKGKSSRCAGEVLASLDNMGPILADFASDGIVAKELSSVSALESMAKVLEALNPALERFHKTVDALEIAAVDAKALTPQQNALFENLLAWSRNSTIRVYALRTQYMVASKRVETGVLMIEVENIPSVWLIDKTYGIPFVFVGGVEKDEECHGPNARFFSLSSESMPVR
ncbi:MAG: hypothetical protein WCU88_04625 [Elusimicrobiota bacterium]|jgi:hypothetical protein